MAVQIALTLTKKLIYRSHLLLFPVRLNRRFIFFDTHIWLVVDGKYLVMRFIQSFFNSSHLIYEKLSKTMCMFYSFPLRWRLIEIAFCFKVKPFGKFSWQNLSVVCNWTLLNSALYIVRFKWKNYHSFIHSNARQ